MKLNTATVLLAGTVLSVFLTCAAGQQLVNFKLSARNLPDKDKSERQGSVHDSRPDAFAVLSGEFISDRTSTLDDNSNPDWPEVFPVISRPGQVQKITVEVRDNDPLSPDDHIGWVDFLVSDIADVEQFATEILEGPEYRGILLVTRVP